MLPVSAPSPSNDLIKLINSIHFIYPILYFPSKYFLIHTTRIIYSLLATSAGTGGAVDRHWWRSRPALVAQCVKGLLPR
jgi:hypothetical protein